MHYDLVSAEHVDGYHIRLSFEDGKSGIVDFRKYIGSGELFQRLADYEYFLSFRVDRELGVITWNGELDIAPETLYSDATGEPLPAWMDAESSARSENRPVASVGTV